MLSNRVDSESPHPCGHFDAKIEVVTIKNISREPGWVILKKLIFRIALAAGPISSGCRQGDKYWMI